MFKMEDLLVGTEHETVTNPYSGESCVLCPLAVALYDYILGCESLGEPFGEALSIFYDKWPEEYMILLD